MYILVLLSKCTKFGKRINVAQKKQQNNHTDCGPYTVSNTFQYRHVKKNNTDMYKCTKKCLSIKMEIFGGMQWAKKNEYLLSSR